MDVLFSIRATCHLLEQTVHMWLGPDAVSPSRMHVMMVLMSAGRPVAQKHVVGALKVSRAAVSVLIETLEKSGHVTAVPGGRDRRNTLIALTRRMTESNARRMLDALQDLPETDQDELLRLLGCVRDSFRKHGRNALHFPSSDAG